VFNTCVDFTKDFAASTIEPFSMCYCDLHGSNSKFVFGTNSDALIFCVSFTQMKSCLSFSFRVCSTSSGLTVMDSVFNVFMAHLITEGNNLLQSTSVTEM
jgi:hypothetical protein